jgi:hypothetical protein
VLQRQPVAAVTEAAFEGPDGTALVYAKQGDACYVRARIRFLADAEDPMFAVALTNELGHIAFATSSNLVLGPSGTFSAGDEVTLRVRFDNWLAPGRYQLVTSVTGDGSAENAYDLREDIASMIVWSEKSGGGATDLPHTLELERHPA